MGILTRRVPFDRKRLVERADQLACGWRWRKALALYRQVLAAEPRCIELHTKAAPLLARSGRHYEAWTSYALAVESLRANDATNATRSLLVEAVKALPHCTEAYRALASVELERGRHAEAAKTLVRGSRKLAKKRRIGEAIVLLRDAREITKWAPQVVLPLCRLLWRDGQPAEALFLLDQLAERVTDAHLREVNRLIFRIEPSLRHAWSWLRAPKPDPEAANRPAKSRGVSSRAVAAARP